MLANKLLLPTTEQALPGRDMPIALENKHYVSARHIMPPFTQDDSKYQSIILGLGCFWGAERKFWDIDGVYTTAVGYTAGITRNPSYEEVCTGLTGHNEVVLIVFDPLQIKFENLIKIFFESHNPTQGMRQGNDQGTQYRSGIYYTNSSQQAPAEIALKQYQIDLHAAGLSPITTEILELDKFYYAEQYHQQYLAKNPAGYCGIGGTGVSCSV